MKDLFKKLKYGFMIWIIPFVVSFFIWDVEANAPSVSGEIFSAIMFLALSIGFAIAAYKTFGKQKKVGPKEGLRVGLIWFIELLILDLIVLVGVFGMAMADYYIMFLSYLSIAVLATAVGYIKK